MESKYEGQNEYVQMVEAKILTQAIGKERYG